MPTRFLSKRLVLGLHRDLVDTFGGVHGIRDEAALDSALAQPSATFRRRLLHPTLAEQAAAYLFHLCQAHGFVDGNERVAFAAMDTFLRLHHHRITLADDSAFELTMRVARGDIGKDEVAHSIEAHLART